MRLTLINQFYKPDISPTARLAASLAEHRARFGDEVTVVASRGGYVMRGGSESKSGNPRVRRIWTPQFGKGSAARRMVDWATFYILAFWTVLTLDRQDIIISLTTPPYIAWAAVFHKLIHRKTRIVLWNMDCYPDVLERSGHIRRGGFLSVCLRAISRSLFRHLSAIICLDSAMSDLLMRGYVSHDNRLQSFVIPNWENAAEFPAACVAGDRKRSAVASSAPTLNVLYMGNAGYGHEFDTILNVAEATRDLPIRFQFVGGGARRASIEQARSSRQLQNIFLQEYVPEEEKHSVLCSADCALITLADFALGIMSPSKLHANLAMGLPVLYIGPAGSNVDDAIQRFDCGGSFRNGDVTGVVEFLRKIREDAEYRDQLRRGARQAFDSAYCDLKTLPLFDSILNDLV